MRIVASEAYVISSVEYYAKKPYFTYEEYGLCG